MTSKDHALTYSENRLKLCLICKKKTKHKLQPAIIQIQERSTNYNRHDENMPAAICETCKFKV